LAFESSDAPGYDPDAGRRLQLLLPAYEAGLEQWRCLAPSRTALASLIDTLTEPIVLFDANGREQYRNRALANLLAVEPGAETLMRLAHRLASSADVDLLSSRRTIELEGGTYVLRAGASPLREFRMSGTLVMVERTSPYPPPAVLQDRFALTPREAEVTLLLARGLSNDALAERLFISPHTVRHHVERVLRKLGVASRSAVADALLQSRD
jgi:DNA-binding CsgD family transcriptional regulator